MNKFTWTILIVLLITLVTACVAIFKPQLTVRTFNSVPEKVVQRDFQPAPAPKIRTVNAQSKKTAKTQPVKTKIVEKIIKASKHCNISKNRSKACAKSSSKCPTGVKNRSIRAKAGKTAYRSRGNHSLEQMAQRFAKSDYAGFKNILAARHGFYVFVHG